MNFGDLFTQQIIATSLWEWLAVLLALAYVLLAVRESRWCWPAAFVSTAIYSLLFFDVNLYMESALNVYYLLMAVYGWQQWRPVVSAATDAGNVNLNTDVSSKLSSNKVTSKTIIVWSWRLHLSLITGISALVFVVGYWLASNTDQDFAYVDSFTTLFAVLTTYMVAKKELHNWLYWIVIDSVSIYLYLEKGFALTAVLFGAYLLIALFGWFKWLQHYHLQNRQSVLRSPIASDYAA